MATGTQPTRKGFEVKVVGEYFAYSGVMGKEVVVKPYEITAVIPSLVSALSIVKNKILAPMLSQKHSDYKAFRTYHIVKITPLDEKSKSQMKKVEVQYMTRPMLISHIEENHLPVDSNLYPDLFKLRVAVQEATKDPDSYLKKLELRRDDLEMDLEISKLNPGIHEKEAPASVSIANSGPSGAATPAAKPRKKRNLSNETINKQAEDRVDGLRHDMIKTNEHAPTAEEELEDI